MKAHNIKKVCENKLEIEFRDGAEFNGWFKYEGKKITRVTIPHGRKEIPPGTLRSIATQLKISLEQLADLERCPFKLEHYISTLRIKVPDFPRS